MLTLPLERTTSSLLLHAAVIYVSRQGQFGSLRLTAASPLYVEALFVESLPRVLTPLKAAASHRKTVDKLHRLLQALRCSFPEVPA